MAPKKKNAITPTRDEDYPQWYQEVVKAADLAENAPVRGCMVIKPWGYALWEKIQALLNQKIKETGHENAYFPLFIPLSYLEKEAQHVEGFAKECAVVTHHRLELQEGRLIPTGELEEPLVVRPTSETIIGMSFSKWVQSHRDLPLLINQWANVVRWEMRPRLFLRTVEFLWQEGHTAHATAKEAQEETIKMLGVYRDFVQNVLAIPVIEGTKTPLEKFPGADETYCIEAMMQDRKALQMGTSHNLGQNFAKSFEIKFNNLDGQVEYAYTTSWGVSTRMIGGLIMVHSDDDGLCLPPLIAPKQVVIIPFITDEAQSSQVLEGAKQIQKRLAALTLMGYPLEIHIDERDLRGGEKNWQWIKKGVPLRLEVGMRDLNQGTVQLKRRDRAPQESLSLPLEQLEEIILGILNEMQESMILKAKAFADAHIRSDIKSWSELKTFMTPKNSEKPEIHGGFVKGKWCGSSQCEERLESLKVSIRCLPLQQSGGQGACLICGYPATQDAILAKSY